MSVVCQLCQQEFQKQINNKHLQYAHNISCAEYKAQFGVRSLISEEYALERKAHAQKINESRKGVPRTEEVKKKVSDSKKGTIAWNKGLHLEDEKYKKGGRKNLGKPSSFKGMTNRFTAEQKQRISEKSKAQAKAVTPEQRQEITKKCQQTSEPNRLRRRLQTNVELQQTLLRYGFILLADTKDLEMRYRSIAFECITCGSITERSPNSVLHDKMCSKCHYDPLKSSVAEFEIAEFLETLVPASSIVKNTRMVINPLELDLYLPQHKLAIEHCGLYWHSDNNGCSRYYHRHKMEVCKAQGIVLLQIFEDEWLHKQDIVKQRIAHKLGFSAHTVFARKCKVLEIDVSQAKDFLETHHVQGYFGCTYRFGLFDNNDLVAVMTISKPNITKGKKQNSNTWEIGRLASSKNIPGGANKLFQYFVRNYKPQEVFTYADLRWNTGQVYEQMGFTKVSEGYPNYWYISGTKRIHRYTLRKTPDEPKDKTEWEIRQEQGWNRIWDCGSSKWVWKSSTQN